MRERMRFVLAACFYYLGIVGLVLWWRRQSRRSLVILNYHHAAGGKLREQMLYLRRHYRVLHLEEALDELYAPQRRAEQHDKRPPLVLTFDDGYIDNYVEALKCARELQIPITLFLIPGYVESGTYFWWKAGNYLASATSAERVTIDGHTYTLAQPKERQELARVIDKYLRFASSVAERENFLAEIQQTLAVALPQRRAGEDCDLFLPLTWEQVREMHQSGWVSFGAHTMHHPILGYLSDADECRREVRESRRVLEQKLGHPIRTFAYPVGQWQHIGERSIQAAKEAGFTWAVTTFRGVNTSQTEALLLKRLPGDYRAHWLVTASVAAGLLGVFARMRKKK